MSKALLKSTGIVSAMTSLSRVTGFVRDMVYAQMFGAGSGTDAFFVAFRIPNLLRRLFAEGAFSQAFVPVFSEYQTQRSREELQELVDQVAGTLGAILLLITAIGVVAEARAGVSGPSLALGRLGWKAARPSLTITLAQPG